MARGNRNDIDQPEEGRAKHLSFIILEFYRRGGTWGEFGEFLRKQTDGEYYTKRGEHQGLHEIKCRHNEGGKHYPELVRLRALPFYRDRFPEPQFYRPCTAVGSGEEGKATGVVAHSVVRNAVAYLESIGKSAQINGGSDFDPDYSPSQRPDDDDDAMDLSLVSEGPFETEQQPGGDDRYYQLVVPDAELEDPEGQIDILVSVADTQVSQASAESVSGSFEHPPGHQPSQSEAASSSQEEMDMSIGTDGLIDPDAAPLSPARGASTKLREATLSYLRNFAGRPKQLRREFLRLCTDPSLLVLHLCGCGMGTSTEKSGCSEYTHLRLGTSAENWDHRHYHAQMDLIAPLDYLDNLAVVHRGRSGEGLL